MLFAENALSGVECIPDYGFGNSELSLPCPFVLRLLGTEIHAQLVACHERVQVVHPEKTFTFDEDFYEKSVAELLLSEVQVRASKIGGWVQSSGIVWSKLLREAANRAFSDVSGPGSVASQPQ